MCLTRASTPSLEASGGPLGACCNSFRFPRYIAIQWSPSLFLIVRELSLGHIEAAFGSDLGLHVVRDCKGAGDARELTGVSVQ